MLSKHSSKNEWMKSLIVGSTRVYRSNVCIHQCGTRIYQEDLAQFEERLPKDYRQHIRRINVEIYRRYLAAVPFNHQGDTSQLLNLPLESSRSLDLTELNMAFTINPSCITAEDVL